MSKAQQTRAQAFLERISRGAVPMGGFYWVDPKALRSQSTSVAATAATPAPTARRASATIDAPSPETLPASATALQASPPAWRSATAGQVSAIASPTSRTAWRRAAVVRRSAALAQRIGLFLIGAHASIREPSETVSTGCTQHARGERS
jgi:hypothetical protein